jgi:exosortase C (VPDSG-CTERM-specific)
MNDVSHRSPAVLTARWRAFGVMAAALLIGFYRPLQQLVRHTLGSDLESHLTMIPLVSAYLVFSRLRRARGSRPPASSGPVAGFILFAVAAAARLLALALGPPAEAGLPADALSLTVFSLVTFLVGSFAWTFGTAWLRWMIFPLLFAYFAVPLPANLITRLQTDLQHWSADATAWILTLAGTPYVRDGQYFAMPGLTIEVAEECSGIHSTLVLFITSLLAGHLLLRSRWRRTALVLAVLPIGILRNGLRVVVISLLTIHVDPNVINGPLHRHGGPVFFLLSLAALLAVLVMLRCSERSPPGGGGDAPL